MLAFASRLNLEGCEDLAELFAAYLCARAAEIHYELDAVEVDLRALLLVLNFAAREFVFEVLMETPTSCSASLVSDWCTPLELDVSDASLLVTFLIAASNRIGHSEPEDAPVQRKLVKAIISVYRYLPNQTEEMAIQCICDSLNSCDLGKAEEQALLFLCNAMSPCAVLQNIPNLIKDVLESLQRPRFLRLLVVLRAAFAESPQGLIDYLLEIQAPLNQAIVDLIQQPDIDPLQVWQSLHSQED
jgi:hypothetical protein